MATWMVHLRIADRLLDQIPVLSPVEFIVGNIAPDSGVPNGDWSKFTPAKDVSHFKTDGIHFDISAFSAKYFTAKQQAGYTEKQYSFYLGYLVHLLTDTYWVSDILLPSREKNAAEFAALGKAAFTNRIKEDWYDLDYKYLRDHPGFRAFRVYLGAVGFVNEFMEEFSPDAFDNRRMYITDFYLRGKEHLDREYPYLTEAQMDAFVEDSVEKILEMLKSYTSFS